MKISKETKYWIVDGLGAVVAALSYIVNQPIISEATVISTAILVIGLVIHDLENDPDDQALSSQNTTPPQA